MLVNSLAPNRKDRGICACSGYALRRLAVVASLAFAAYSASAQSIDDLLKDRIAVERVYYAHQIGQKPSFEVSNPRSSMEHRVQMELLKEATLHRVYAIDVTPDLVSAEVDRIQKTTMAAAMLHEIQQALGNDPQRFARSVAKPIIVDRVLRSRFNSDEAPQFKIRQSLESLRTRLLAAKPGDREALLRKESGAQEVVWSLGTRPKNYKELSLQADAKSHPVQSYFNELHPQMQKVLNAQLQKSGDVSAVFASDDRLSLYVLRQRSEAAVTVLALEKPKLDFDTWLAAQPR